jgi:hypothetical protein
MADTSTSVRGAKRVGGITMRCGMRLAAVALAMLAASACAPAARVGPTPVPKPPEVKPLARGVEVSGHGTSQTDPITPQYDSGLNVGIDVVSLSHDGRSSFVVSVIEENGGTEPLVSAIGAYQGQRPLVVSGPVAFSVTADGNWTLKVQPIPQGATPNFQGAGDAVGGYFTPPPAGQWQVTHDGQSAFYVYAHCLGGSVLVANSQGAVQSTTRVEFPRGPCFWEVRADGNWSLQTS